MARESVSYEQVELACNQLRADGTKPTVRLLVQRLGGSNTTILELLKKWRSANPETVAVRPGDELPVDVLSSLQAMRDRAEASGRADFAERLKEAEAERDDLSRENRQFQADADEKGAGLAALTTERDTLQGRLNEQAAELSTAKNVAVREHAAAEAARVELAKTQLQGEAAAARVTEQRQEITQLRAQIDALQVSLRSAEQAGAVAAAQLDAEHHAIQAATGHIAELQARIEHVQQSAAQAQAQAQTEATRAAAAEATVAGLREQLQQAGATATLLRELLTAKPGA